MDIFVLDDRNGNLLNPNLQATILAKYSRSAESARDIMSTITESEAVNFGKKWVINYGHSSVAELATIPICYEGISMIASKFIEGFQRGGYSEKSTRYQRFSIDSFVDPDVSGGTASKFVKRFYDAYEQMYPKMMKIVLEKMGLEDSQQNRSLAKVKARVFDNLRYLLPAGTGTNLAAVLNLRDVRYLISLARAHTNSEIREIGERTFQAVSKMCPSLVTKADPNHFELPIKTFAGNNIMKEGAHLIHLEENAVEKIVSNVKTLYGMEWPEFERHLTSRGLDQLPNVCKSVKLGYMLVMDYGAYRDLQRHRRCEQYSEIFTPWIGYSVPDDIVGSELEPEYRRVMELATIFEDDISNDPDKLQYVVPMGYLHRSIFQLDLRELYYIVELRTKPQGHISYRRIAYQMFESANAKIPELMKWCRAVKPDEIGDHL